MEMRGEMTCADVVFFDLTSGRTVYRLPAGISPPTLLRFVAGGKLLIHSTFGGSVQAFGVPKAAHAGSR